MRVSCLAISMGESISNEKAILCCCSVCWGGRMGSGERSPNPTISVISPLL